MNEPQDLNSEPIHDIENEMRKPDLVCSQSSKKWDKDVDMTRVQNAINETGNNSYGIVGVDVWYLNEENGTLSHFNDSGINWVSPIYKHQLKQGNIEMKDMLDSLEQVNEQTVETEISGFGLAGNFWQLYGDSAGTGGDWSQPLLWRDLREFTTDPDQMPSARLITLSKVFGKCTGIPFSIQGKFKGVVLYFVRAQCDVTAMTSDVNTNFLHFSSQYIGAASAMTEARTKSVAKRKEIATKTWNRFMMAFRAARAFKSHSSLPHSSIRIEDTEALKPAGKQQFQRFDNFRKLIHKTNRIWQAKAKSLYKKSTKPPLSPPPRASVATSVWIFFGCFITLLVLFGLNFFVKDISNDDYAIILGPFGALLTLQFALTAAPAAQPRNSIYGFALSLVISLLCKFLLFELAFVPQWIAAVIGVSLAIGGMAKAGVVHPPGGAAALIFAMSENSIAKDLSLAGILLCADLVAIFMATLINNLSDTRQYPMYWSIFPKCRKDE